MKRRLHDEARALEPRVSLRLVHRLRVLRPDLLKTIEEDLQYEPQPLTENYTTHLVETLVKAHARQIQADFSREIGTTLAWVMRM